MLRNRITSIMTLMTLGLIACAPVLAASRDKVEVKGMISARVGETMVVRNSDGNTTVVLTDNTTTKDDKGLFGLDKHKMSNVVLVPGLKVRVEGVVDEQGKVEAKTITVDGDDLETAEMIQAGLQPTAEQVDENVQAIAANQHDIAAHKSQLSYHEGKISANEQTSAANRQRIEENMRDIQENTARFMALADYDVKGQATVNFGIASTRVSPQDQEKLKELAQSATALSGYIIEVTGYADATGSAVMNTKLSEDRAKAVISVLMQQGNIPVRRILAPGAMGEYGSAAPNETKSGRAANRRVEVKVLVNKGISGS